MSREIKGNIPYTLTISDENEWIISYESDINNDMASLAIAQRVMEICAVKLREDKRLATGKGKKHLSEKLNKAISGRFGLMVICDYMQDVYEQYSEYLKNREINDNIEDGNTE